jgi:hypothetical protein
MTDQKWLLPFRRTKRNYENIGVLPYALEHDRGFSGDKLYKLVRRLPDGGFVHLLDGTYYDRARAVKALHQAAHANRANVIANPASRLPE